MTPRTHSWLPLHRPARRRQLLRAGGAWLAALAAPAVHASTPLHERLLSAVGGRAAWAALTLTRNDSQQNRLDDPTTVRAVVTLDFTRLRLRIDTTAPGLRLARAIDGPRHWRLTRAGAVEPIPEATLAEDRRWHAGHVYRTLHRIATADPTLALKEAGARRLEVAEAGSRIAWFETDAQGEPVRFGAVADEEGSLCGPWAFEVGGVRHPVWTARRDGSWRAWLRGLELNPVLPARFFEEP